MKKYIYIIPFLLFLIVTVNAESDTTYTGSLSSSFVSYAEDIIRGLDSDIEYCFGRTDDYEYSLFVGSDLVRSGGMLSSSGGGTLYRLRTVYTGSGYNNYISLDSEFVDSYSLIFGDEIIYSSIAGFPCFESGNKNLEALMYVQAFCLFSVFCYLLISNVFKRISGRNRY